MKLREVLEIDKNNKIEIIDDKEYVIAGIQSYGKGVVNRRTEVGSNLTMKKYQLIKENQLMWCKVDTKNGAFGVTRKEHINSLASTNMALANINTDKVNVDFLELLFRTEHFYNNINDMCTGTTNRKYLKVNEVLDLIEIPDLSLDEQNKFMRKYSEFEEEYFKLRNIIDDQIQNIQLLKNSILQDAVQGKLVPQDPNDEPAEVLLEKIKEEKEILIKEKKIKKEKPLAEISDNPYIIPSRWSLVRLGTLAKGIEYGTSTKADLDQSKVPVLRMNNIIDGKIDYKNLKYVDSDIKDLPRLYLNNKDLLFNRTNSYELVGKTAVFKGLDNSMTFASYLIRIELFNEMVNADYINIVMNSNLYRISQIEPEITQQNGQANFNGTKLKSTIIPLPPIEEQKRIVEKVNSLMILCDELEKKIQKQKDYSNRLMESILKSSF